MAMRLSHTAYAQLVAKTHAMLGYGQMAARREKISRWESGRVVPESTAQLAIAHIHNVPVDLLRRLVWPQWLYSATGGSAQFDLPWTPAAAIGALRVSDSGGPEARITCRADSKIPRLVDFISGFEKALSSDGDTDTRGSSTFGPPVSDEEIQWISARVEGIEDGSMRITPSFFLPGANIELRLVTDHLAFSRYRRATGARLLHLAGRVAALCGELSISLAEPAAAERYLVAAVRAQSMGDTPHWAPASMSSLAVARLELGHLQDALHLIRAAQSSVRRPSTRLRRLLSAREALVHAALGDRVASARALDDATATLFAGPCGQAGEEDPELEMWLQDVDEEWLTIRAGMAMRRWGNHARALDHFSVLLDEGASARPRTHPAVMRELLEAADALLSCGEPEAAARIVRRAMDVHHGLPAGHSQRVRHRFGKYRAVQGVREVLELLEQGPAR